MFKRRPLSDRARRLMDAEGRRLENLESRQMMAADLGVQFDDFQGVPPTLIPGDRVGLPIVVRNVGDSAAIGRVSIDYYLSTDTVLDANDTLLRTFANQPVQLSAGGFPNDTGDFEGIVDIPTITPGNYFFLVRIRPNSDVGDFNQSNNVSTAEDAIAFAWRFGTFDNRTNATLTLTDPSGTAIDFGLSGGGSGTVTRDPANAERFNVVLTGTGGNSRFSIAASGGSGPTAGIALINDISGGTLQSIEAASARLHGDVTLTGTLASAQFRDVTGPSVITVQTGTVNTTYTFGAVADLTINSAAPIAALSVTNWNDSSAGGVDVISAPWLGTLTSTRYFQASLSLSGAAGNQRTLGEANIGGAFAKGAWDIGGRSGSMTFRSIGATASISVEKALTAFTVNGNFKAVLAAKSIQRLDIALNMRNAMVLAGAYLGTDGRLGGEGDAADTFALGNIKNITVGRQVISSTIGAGLDPVDGEFGNGDDVLRGGKITGMTVERRATMASRFLARRYAGSFMIDGQAVVPAEDPRFQL